MQILRGSEFDDEQLRSCNSVRQIYANLHEGWTTVSSDSTYAPKIDNQIKICKNVIQIRWNRYLLILRIVLLPMHDRSFKLWSFQYDEFNQPVN